MKKIADCECGAKPGIKFIHGSTLRLRAVGCEECRTTSPARMDTNSTIDLWNAFKRNDKNGNRKTYTG